MSYPKWKYHKSSEPTLVHSEEQEKALSNEWVETPAAFESKEQVAAQDSEEAQSLKPLGEEEKSETQEKKPKRQRAKE